jgi:hypothetical protein
MTSPNAVCSVCGCARGTAPVDSECPDGIDRMHDWRVDFDHELTDNAVCPHCGYEDLDSWESGGGDEGTFETYCNSCGGPFYLTRDISVSYTTRVITPADREREAREKQRSDEQRRKWIEERKAAQRGEGDGHG